MPNKILKSLLLWTPISGSVILLIILCLIIAPVVLNPFPPLHDYPHHLARIIILSDLENPIYHQFYKHGSFLIPNMAMEIIAVPLAHLMGAEAASRLFVMLSLLSMMLGTVMLHKVAHKRFSPWPLLAVMFLFNCFFRFGFLNYIFGIGASFFAASIWLSIKPGYNRFFLTLLTSFILILLHFSAFGIFALLVCSFEIYETTMGWQQKKVKQSVIQLLVTTIPFFITISLFMLFSPTAEIISEKFAYPSYFGAKPFGAFYSILTSITWLNIVCLSSLVIAVSLTIYTKSIKISSPLSVAFIVISIALVLLPSSLMGNVFVDVRLGPVIALLGIAAIDIKANHLKMNSVIAGLAILLATLISIGISYQWRDFNVAITKNISVFDSTEVGATIFSATSLPDPQLITDTPERRAAWNPTLKHIASYAVLYGAKFVPMTFANPRMQPLNVSDEYLAIKAFQGDNPRKVINGSQLKKFIMEIKKNVLNENWPKLHNIYIFVMGFERVKDSFDISDFNDEVKVIEFDNNHILLSLILPIKPNKK